MPFPPPPPPTSARPKFPDAACVRKELISIARESPEIRPQILDNETSLRRGGGHFLADAVAAQRAIVARACAKGGHRYILYSAKGSDRTSHAAACECGSVRVEAGKEPRTGEEPQKDPE